MSGGEGPGGVAMVAQLGEWSGAPAAAVRYAGLLRGGDNPRVVVVFPGEGEAAARARAAGLDVEVCPQSQESLRGGLWARMAGLAGKLAGCARLGLWFRRRRIGLAWIHGTAGIWPGVAARLAGARVLWHVHELHPPGGSWGSAVRKWLVLRLAHGLVFAGESARRNWLGEAAGSWRCVEVLPNPLEPGVWSRLAATEPLRPNPPGAGDEVVVLASGLFSRKAPDRLLRGAAMWGRPVRVVLIGEGRSGAVEERFQRDLEGLIAGLPPSVRVERPGAVADVFSCFGRAHVFASLGRSEVAPLLLVEAMAAGVPVVVSDTGEQAALCGRGERGVVVADAGDPGEVARALEQVMGAGSGATADRCQRARAFALGMHDPAEAARRARQIVEGILARRTGGRGTECDRT